MQDDGAVYDAWGEPLPDTPPRSMGRWYLGGAICILLLVAGGALLYVRSATIASLSESCRTALHRQDWKQLDTLAKRWRWWAPYKAAPLIYLAESAYQKGALEHSVHLLTMLPDDDPLTPPAIVEQSSILFGPLNRPIQGAEVLERAVRLDPKNTEARRRLIFFYAFTLQRQKMADHIYEAIRQQCDPPEIYVYLVERDWLSFSNAYAENTKWSLGNPDEELFLVSRAIYRVLTRGLDYSEDPTDEPVGSDGTPYHQQVIAGYFEQFPKNLELLVYYLEMAMTKGDTDEVVRLLGNAPEAAAEDNRFWRYMGWARAARGEFQDAETAYEKALKINPYDYRSQHQLAGVARALRKFDRVEKLENLSRQGTSLRRDILIMDSVDKVPPEILKRIAEYAAGNGDVLVAERLMVRLQEWAPEALQPAAPTIPPRSGRPVPGPGATSPGTSGPALHADPDQPPGEIDGGAR